MIRRFASLAVVASAAAVFSSGAIAVPVGVAINIGPPPPRVEVVPVPRAGYLWTPGYWNWRHGRHYWVAGTWVRERRGYIYTRPEWVDAGGHWRLRHGGWARGPHYYRDHDGVPNRYDRHPNDPYRR